MQILLLSMPDSFEHTPTIAVRMPNGGLASLAGNVDSHHQVAIADLILAQSSVQATVVRLMQRLQPRLVGLSVMTFQRGTARRIISLIRSIKPDVLVAVGGYDPSLAPEAWTDPSVGVDFIVRGEGDLTFRELLRAIEGQGSLSNISGLWFRSPDGFQRNPARPATVLKDGDVRPPSRAARVLSGYTMMGRSIDVVETSRGCTFDCSFCSIIEMRGRNFYRFSIDRVIADIRDAHDRGARSIFLVDDNITIDVPRLEALCRAIVEHGLDDIMYVVQAMTAAIATHGASLAPLMRQAGFRYVFLGNPDDTRSSIETNLAFARKYVDWPYIQHPTPYPGTPMTRDFRERGLIVNQRVEEYDGTSAVTRSAHLDAEEIEFMRWRAERWMKVRHIPTAFRLHPGFVLRHWRGMMTHTFRGTTWRALIGLESVRDTFRRYRQIRAQEREYLAWPDPLAAQPPAEPAVASQALNWVAR